MVQESSSDGSSSICVQPAFAPIHYHWFRTAETRRLIDDVRELVSQLQLSDDDRDRLIGEFVARVQALEAGILKPVRHIKGPMESVTSIDVYELRTGIDVGEDGRVELRLYHVEPRKLHRAGGSTVVGLHVHNKDLSDPATIRALQDAELQKARKRYFEGRPTNWGGAPVPLPRLGL